MENEHFRHQESQEFDIPMIRLSQTDQDYEGYGWGSITEGDIVITNGYSEYRSYGGFKLHRRETLSDDEKRTLKTLVNQFIETKFTGIRGCIGVEPIENYDLTVGNSHIHAYPERETGEFPEEFWKLITYLNRFFLPKHLRDKFDADSNS